MNTTPSNPLHKMSIADLYRAHRTLGQFINESDIGENEVSEALFGLYSTVEDELFKRPAQDGQEVACKVSALHDALGGFEGADRDQQVWDDAIRIAGVAA